VGVEIVEHDSEPLVRILFDHRVQKGQEIFAGAPFTHVSDDSSGTNNAVVLCMDEKTGIQALRQLAGRWIVVLRATGGTLRTGFIKLFNR